MDAAAKLAIEATLAGLAEAKVLSFDQLAIVLQSIEDAAASRGSEEPDVEEALDALVGEVRSLTGCYPGRQPPLA